MYKIENMVNITMIQILNIVPRIHNSASNLDTDRFSNRVL